MMLMPGMQRENFYFHCVNVILRKSFAISFVALLRCKRLKVGVSENSYFRIYKQSFDSYRFAALTLYTLSRQNAHHAALLGRT